MFVCVSILYISVILCKWICVNACGQRCVCVCVCVTCMNVQLCTHIFKVYMHACVSVFTRVCVNLMKCKHTQTERD